MTLMPAYGKQYTNEHEVLEDWHNGVTFKIVGGNYIDMNDFNKYCEPVLDTVTYFYDGLNVNLNLGCLI
jgi:hypothetical protein